MERPPDTTGDEPDDEAEEYPAGTELPTEPPGVDPEGDEDAQPGFGDDPPQAD